MSHPFRPSPDNLNIDLNNGNITSTALTAVLLLYGGNYGEVLPIPIALPSFLPSPR